MYTLLKNPEELIGKLGEDQYNEIKIEPDDINNNLMASVQLITIEGSFYGNLVMNSHYLMFFSLGEPCPTELMFANHV